MSKEKFAAYTFAGCLPWNITLVYVGWWLGASWEEATAAFRYVNLVVYAVLILLAVWIGWWFTAKRKTGSRS
jgi:membrane protein DedA with SNARE-associated domain